MTATMYRLLIIPAAGLGSRLGAHTPKLLALVNGRPMLDHLLALYAPVVQRVALVVHPSARIWITWCDQVAIHPRTVQRLTAADRDDPLLAMPTCVSAFPYVHLERDPAGRIIRVLHRREGDDMPASGESDAGLFSLSREAYMGLLPEFAAAAAPLAGSATGERNFLPFIPWVAARGSVATFPCTEAAEAVGVNTPEDLAVAERTLRARERENT